MQYFNEYQSPTNLATQKTLYPSLISRKGGALHFSKYPRFTTFLLFLVVGEVSNISSKYLLPNKSANFFTQDTLPLLDLKKIRSHHRSF